MGLVDNTANITFHVIDSLTGDEMARSKEELTIKVVEECPFSPDPSDPQGILMATTNIPDEQEVQSSALDLFQTLTHGIDNVSGI